MAEAKKDEKAVKTKLPTAKKRNLQSIERNLRNRAFKSKVQTAMRSLETSLSQNDATLQKKHLDAIYSLVDKGVKTGVFKLNQAGRIKSRLSSKVKA